MTDWQHFLKSTSDSIAEMSHEHPYPGQVLRKVKNLDSYDKGDEDRREVVRQIDEANVVTSEVDGFNGYQKPVLDIDFAAKLRPSSTPGHYHLYLDKPMTTAEYVKLLRVLAEVGIIEQGYAELGEDRGYTAVRLPWIKKGQSESEA